MKKPKRVRRKARFRVRQVVMCNVEGVYAQISSIEDDEDGAYYGFYSTKGAPTWAHESELRPLNKRERGQ